MFVVWGLALAVALSRCLHAAEDHAARLAREGLLNRVIGWDTNGIPFVCGSEWAGRIELSADSGPAGKSSALPEGFWSWECAPSVIRTDTNESFRLEITRAGTNVGQLFVDIYADSFFRNASNSSASLLRDDGTNGDRVAGDSVYTTEPLFFRLGTIPLPTHYQDDTNSPAGMFWAHVPLKQIDSNGDTNSPVFLTRPEIGILSTNIPLVESMRLSDRVMASPWVLNVQWPDHMVQSALHSVPGGSLEPFRAVYAAVEDAFDFLLLVATHHVEQLPFNASANFVSGLYIPARISFTGTGKNLFTNTAVYGSAGRLQAVNFLDTASRGLWANNAVHEIMHHWAAFLSPTLGLNFNGPHYQHQSTIGSVLGGSVFTNGPLGQMQRDCNEELHRRRVGALDRYLMGLTHGSNVPPIRLFASLPVCGASAAGETGVVTIAQIQALHGVRSPGPGAAQRSFTLGFVVESIHPLNRAEMTFYSRLAEHFTRPLLTGPDPSLLYWPSIRRHFGADTEWQSGIAALTRARSMNVNLASPTHFTLRATGFPGQTYRLERSSDLRNWQTHLAVTAQTNGEIFVQATNINSAGASFLRLAWPW